MSHNLASQLTLLEDIPAKQRAAVLDNARLYNEVQDLRGAIRVFCRVRPAGATGDGSPPCVEVGVDGNVRPAPVLSCGSGLRDFH